MRIYLFLLFFVASLTAKENDYFDLRGHLSQERLQPFQSQIETWQADPPKKLGITLRSSSGDLEAVLAFAQKLYALKQSTELEIFIEDQALGPSAIFPFLADRIIGSSFFAWGDIPLGADRGMPTNLLQNRVLSLINPKSSQYPLLRLLATAMSDPNMSVIDDNGWKIANAQSDPTKFKISVSGQTLVVNQNQVRDLGLLQGTTTRAEFEAQFHTLFKRETAPLTAFDDRLQKYIRPKTTGSNTIGKITIDDRTSGITQATWIYVKNALDYYKTHPPLFIILELNTPGGEVLAAQKISDALKEMDTQYNIPVVAFINNWAISAGAMLAYSSRFISVVKDGAMGAAEPVLQDSTSGEMKSASEKVNSALRADFANRARFFDRNPILAEAMVDKDMIVVLRHGNILKLDNESQIRTSAPDPDLIISPKGKLLTLDAKQLLSYGVADIDLPPTKLEPVTAVEKEKGKWPANKELLFQYPFFKNIPHSVVDTYQMDWKTLFFVFLANPMVASALVLGLMLGFYIEMNTPGFGVAGTVALTCLFLIILSSFALEIADWLELILLLSGLLILVVELFVLPTFGLLGIIGVILFFAGLFGLMLPGIGAIQFELDTKTFNAAGEAFINRLGWLLGTLLLGFGLIALLARYVTPSLRVFKKFVLEGDEQVGFLAGIDPKQLPALGSQGVAVSALRPAGKVECNGQLYDAMSTGRFIEKNAAVIVKRYEGSTVFVEEREV